MLNSQLKLKGVVSAINRETGEYIFKNHHNTIVFDGCLFTLAKILGLETMSEEDVFYNGLELETKGISTANFSLSKFAPSYNSDATTGSNVIRVRKDSISLSSVLFTEPQEVKFFDGNEEYNAVSPDLPEGSKASKIILDKSTGSSYIRFKLPVLSPFVVNEEMENYKLVAAEGSSLVAVNELGLYLSDGTDNILFSRIVFPTIPFFGNLSVDFEYRIYL